MFLFKVSRYLVELKSHRLDIFEALEKAMSEIESDLGFIRVNRETFET
jgi:mannose-1-phosphate guanylyltransferase